MLKQRMLFGGNAVRFQIAWMLLGLLEISGCASDTVQTGSHDESGQVRTVSTTCGNLGDSLGYEQSQLACYRRRPEKTQPNGCDESWVGDQQWVCETYLQGTVPWCQGEHLDQAQQAECLSKSEWRILNHADDKSVLPTVLGDEVECDLCLGYAPGGNHPNPRPNVIPESVMDGFWRVNSFASDGMAVVKLLTHQGLVRFFSCMVWQGEYVSSVELDVSKPSRVECLPTPVMTAIVAQRNGIPGIISPQLIGASDAQKADDVMRLWSEVPYNPEHDSLVSYNHDYLLPLRIATRASQVIESPVEITGLWDVAVMVGQEAVRFRTYSFDSTEPLVGTLAECALPPCSRTIQLYQTENLASSLRIHLGDMPVTWEFQDAEGAVISTQRTSSIQGVARMTPAGAIAYCQDFDYQNGVDVITVSVCLTPWLSKSE